MFPQAIFISYTIMFGIGLQGISLIVLLVRLSGNKSDKLITTNRNFILVTLLLGILYFITYYNDLVLGDYKTSLLYRLFDGMIFYALGLSWIKVIDGLIIDQNEKVLKLRKFTNYAFAFLMILSSFAYGALLDGLYHTTSTVANFTIVILELLLMFSVLAFTFIYLKMASYKTLDKTTKTYLKMVSILVNASVAWNSAVVLSIFVHIMEVSVLSMYSYGMTSVLMLIINCFIIVYIYKKNVDAIYGNRKSGTGREPVEVRKEKNAEEKIQEVILNYKLTEREAEILKLAYSGLTNPEMGDLLCISKHTAKRHMHNIFEKLHVTTRMEMVHLINGKNSMEKEIP